MSCNIAPLNLYLQYNDRPVVASDDLINLVLLMPKHILQY